MSGVVTLGSDIGDMVPVVAIVLGLSFAGLCVVVGAIKSVLMNRQREQSRRDIAAYIAEGSMSPDEGERLLKAGRKVDDCGLGKRGK